MEYDDDKVIDILQKLPSEGPCIDYKVIPYKKNQNHEFLRDVIAMLNSEVAAGKDKFIVIGVLDSPRNRIGIQLEQWRDDNEWQNLIRKITPRPDVRTGYVVFQEKYFGYIYIPASNYEWVYEANESVISSKDDPLKEKNIIARGQAYIRIGSTNEVLMDDGRKRLLERKIHRTIPHNELIIDSPEEKAVLLSLSFVGGWSEQHEGDIDVVQKLSGLKLQDIKRILRGINEKASDTILFSRSSWKLEDHKSTLLAEANRIYDDHIDLYFEAIRSCFREIDPKYELPADQRSTAALYQKGQKKKYSKAIISGLTESLAILGNNSASFSKCSNEIFLKRRIGEFMHLVQTSFNC